MPAKILSKDELPAGLPQLAVGMKLVEAPPFLGVCLIDQMEQGDYGIQVHIGVKPLKDLTTGDPIKLEGKSGTGCYHSYYTPSSAVKSKCGHLLTGCSKVFPQGTPIGEGALVGTVAVWVRRDLTFGKNRDTGETMMANGVLLPLRRATDEELASVEGMDFTAPTGEPAENTTDGVEWADEEVKALAGILSGRTKKEASLEAGRSKTLPGSLKQAVMNGTAVKQLEARGILSMAADGEHYVIAHEWLPQE